MMGSQLCSSVFFVVQFFSHGSLRNCDVRSADLCSAKGKDVADKLWKDGACFLRNVFSLLTLHNQ